jgi:uncharacterized membrane protein
MSESNKSYLSSSGLTKSSATKWSAIAGGGVLAAYGVARRSALGLAMASAGGTIVYLAATADRIPEQFVAEGNILLNCSPAEAYQMWRDFEVMPLYMNHLESVSEDNGRFHWRIRSPVGKTIEWDARIEEERENDFISWRSTDDSAFQMEGSVEFRAAPANRGTIVKARILYRSPVGSAGKWLAKLFGKFPSFAMRGDLRRFKALVETGEIPTIEGQSHGPRSAVVGALRSVNPDQPISEESTTREIWGARRRIA